MCTYEKRRSRRAAPIARKDMCFQKCVPKAPIIPCDKNFDFTLALFMMTPPSSFNISAKTAFAIVILC